MFLRVVQEDIIHITAVHLGELKKLRIRHNNSNANAAWFLERVEIVDNKDDTTYVGPWPRRRLLLYRL